MTPKQIEASRKNGARSRGPITEAGKQNSARNSTRHGLLAQTVVLDEESADRFLDLFTGYMDEHKPSTATQISLVETMAAARWRQLRVWGAQKTSIDRDMALQDPSVGPASVRVLAALRGSPESFCPPDVLLRYEIAFDRQFSRALTRLLALKSGGDAQPYHPETPAGQTWKDENVSTTKRTSEVIENTLSGYQSPPTPNGPADPGPGSLVRGRPPGRPERSDPDLRPPSSAEP